MKNLTRALVLALSTTAVAGAVVPAAAHAATNVTRYTTATTNIRSAPSIGATKVASVPTRGQAGNLQPRLRASDGSPR